MQSNSFLLYGANGYTGQLITELASQYGLKPILAGRNETSIKALAQKWDFPFAVLDLSDRAELEKTLRAVPLVLHAAGPFQFTAKPMMEACFATGTHYLDITGEIGVFEMARSNHQKAVASGIMLMPGVGFDVVPTDCTALFLKNKLPDATHLKLAFAMLGSHLSHGTASTMLEGMGEGGAVRENGNIVRKPLGHKGFWVDFGIRKKFVMCIPWGDISTAYSTTGIPNIETYAGASPQTFKILKWQKLFNWVLKTSLFRNYYRKKLNKQAPGPSAEMRNQAMSLVWGEVTNDVGQKQSVRLQCPEGYSLTAHSSLLIARKIIGGDFTIGYQTPAGVYGEDLILEIPGVKREY